MKEALSIIRVASLFGLVVISDSFYAKILFFGCSNTAIIEKLITKYAVVV